MICIFQLFMLNCARYESNHQFFFTLIACKQSRILTFFYNWPLVLDMFALLCLNRCDLCVGLIDVICVLV